MVTEGGSADVGFRISRCLQACYKNFTAVVPGWCKSAGTLVCVGASDLQIGELGPLDVQLYKPDELALISSGLTVDSSFRALQSVAFQMFENFMLDIIRKSGGRITTKTAAELADSLTVGLLSPVFAQMDPMKVGEDYRSTRIAEEYALRLDAHSGNLMGDVALDTLVRGYPSHGFVIDRFEATTLFNRVGPIVEHLTGLIDALGTDAVIARSSEKLEAPVLRYLNQEAGRHDQTEDSRPAAGNNGAPGQPASNGRGTPEMPVSSNPTAGDGELAFQVSRGPAKAPRNKAKVI